MALAEELRNFSTEELCSWIENVYHLPGLTAILDNIGENCIDGETFYYLNTSHLEELGFNRFHAPRILALARTGFSTIAQHTIAQHVSRSAPVTQDVYIEAAASEPMPHVPVRNFNVPKLKCQPCQPIPEVDWSDKKALMKHFADQTPCIIKNQRLTGDCAEKWTIDYLKNRIKGDCTVYEAETLYFRYWNEEKNFGKYDFTPPTRNTSVSFAEFLTNVENALSANEQSENKKYYYMQHSLGAGCEDLSRDFASWQWGFLFDVIKRCEWVNLTANLLLIGMKNVLTPLHFDEQENIFCQLRGRKEVILFPPSNFDYLYSFPQGHPCDRQSMVDILDADLESFPRFQEATPLYHVLEPGDSLYLPFMYFHQFRNLDDFATSVTFWCISKPADASEVLRTGTITDVSKVAIRRNLEKLTSDHVGGWDKLNEALSEIASGTSKGNDLKGWMLEILGHLKTPVNEREEMINGIVLGRYGIDHDNWVAPQMNPTFPHDTDENLI